MSDTDSTLRAQTATALGMLGLASRSAIGGLTKALDDKEEMVRQAAIASLGKLGSSSVLSGGSATMEKSNLSVSVFFFSNN